MQKLISVVSATALCLAVLLLVTGCSPVDIQKEPIKDNSNSLCVEIEQKGNEISLNVPEGARIYYTIDGSEPTEKSLFYTGPFDIPKISVLTERDADMAIGHYHVHDGDVPRACAVRAVAIAADGTKSEIATKTCFERNDSITVLSFITDYANLLDYDTGILVKGKIYDEWIQTESGKKTEEDKIYWQYEGNYTQKGRDWERPVILEVYDGENELQINAGIRVKGGMSRIYGQKSFNIYFRKEYGDKILEYDLFENGISEYKGLSLRNGGNTTETLKFKDAWIQGMLKGMDFSVQESKPALLYINGEYWGIYSLQEKYDTTYFEEHYDVSDVVVIKEGELDEGEEEDFALYEDLLTFEDRDLTDEKTWKEFKDCVDIQSMADYFAAQIYIGNYDLGMHKNFSIWRTREKGEGFGDGRWRFVLFDTEFSSSLYEEERTSAEYDHYGHIAEEFPLFTKAMENDEFRELFRGSLQEVRERFAPDKVRETLQKELQLWGPYMEDYFVRFGKIGNGMDTSFVEDYFTKRYAMDIIPIQ